MLDADEEGELAVLPEAAPGLISCILALSMQEPPAPVPPEPTALP